MVDLEQTVDKQANQTGDYTTLIQNIEQKLKETRWQFHYLNIVIRTLEILKKTIKIFCMFEQISHSLGRILKLFFTFVEHSHRIYHLLFVGKLASS